MQQELHLVDSADNLLRWIQFYTRLEQQNQLRILFSNLVSCTQSSDFGKFNLHMKIELL